MVLFGSALALSAAYANTASLKKPKLQSFTTGAMEFLVTVKSVSNGVALAVEGDPDDRSGGYRSHRVVLLDYETGKKTVTAYDTANNYAGNPDDSGFAEGWAVVGKVGGVKKNSEDIGYTFIDPNGRSLSEPKYAYLTNFHNGLAGCRFYAGDDCYTGVLQTDGKVRFAILGKFDVTIGKEYVTMKEAKHQFSYDLEGKRITLTKEILERDVINYRAAERNAFYGKYAGQYTKVDYLGSDRFRVETKSVRKIVDSGNETIYTEASTALHGFPRAFMNGEKLYLQTSVGLCDRDGKIIIPSGKYQEIKPADGDCFVTKLGDKFQMFDSGGKVIATSQYDPMIYLYQGGVNTLFYYLFDSQYRPNGVAYLYTSIDLGRGKSSTAPLRELYKKCRFSDMKADLALKASAQKLMKSSTAQNPGLFAIMSALSRGNLKD
jgi:hypothetical protein